MYYGKLNENKELEYAPSNLGNILNFDKDVDLLKEHGYKPVTDTLRPEYNAFDHYATSEWTENEEGIVKVWTIHEKDKEEVQKAYNDMSLKRGDVFEALILAKGITKAQIRAKIEQADIDATSKALYLNRFDEAIDFYRGHPLFDLMAATLKLTSDQLNKFFSTKNYKHLTTPTLTVSVVPDSATVVINDVEQNSISAPYNTEVSIRITCDGYESHEESLTLIEDATLSIELSEIEVEEPIVEEAVSEEEPIVEEPSTEQ